MSSIWPEAAGPSPAAATKTCDTDLSYAARLFLRYRSGQIARNGGSNMNTATPRVLSGPEVWALSVRSDLLGATQIGIHLALIAGAGWMVVMSGPWTLLPALFLLGVTQSALFAPIHETMHLTAFANRRANAVVGWVAACPSLLNWHFYTVFHLAHHRFTQDPDRDPELNRPPPAALDSYLLRVLAVNYWRARAKVLVDCWRGNLSGYPFVAPACAR